jgi:hypothetical protein
MHYYDRLRSVPSAYSGLGGLGRYWHGVIPTALNPNFTGVTPAEFAALFHHFYPHAKIDERLGEPWLFIPRRPIRTPVEWRRARAVRGDRLRIVHDTAQTVAESASGVEVTTEVGRFLGQRLWIAAGPLHTPGLLRRSVGRGLIRGTVSDHVIAYVGQIDRIAHPRVPAPIVERVRGGFWSKYYLNDDGTGLFMPKPARFFYRKLDWGIEQRAAFGLPTGSAIAKIGRAGSLGLIAEALYNKLGLFPRSPTLSVYAQIRVPDAHDFDPETLALAPRTEAICQAIVAAVHSPPWKDEIIPTRRSDLFLHAIHLHNSVERAALRAAGIDGPGARIQVIDASAAEDIGCEHHSFKMMAGAFAKARRS